jgi:hypothetical protein
MSVPTLKAMGVTEQPLSSRAAGQNILDSTPSSDSVWDVTGDNVIYFILLTYLPYNRIFTLNVR